MVQKRCNEKKNGKMSGRKETRLTMMEKMAPRTGGMNYADYLERAVLAATLAGGLIRKALEDRANNGPSKVLTKDSIIDLVTETDRACEKLIVETLKKAYPDHRFIGEEGVFLGDAPEFNDEPTWVIDPLDGTVNFVHGYTNVCVSIGLVVKKEPVVGVIYNPVLEELYTASSGGGAFLNGKPIRVARAQAINQSVISTTVGAKRDKAHLRSLLSRLEAVLHERVQGLRVSGSTALNIAHVACGRIDAYYDKGGYGGPWDVAAGLVLVKEAGGVYTKTDGSKFTMCYGKGDLVCGNADIVSTLLKTIGGIREGPKVLDQWWSPAVLMLVGAGIGFLLGKGLKGAKGGR